MIIKYTFTGQEFRLSHSFDLSFYSVSQFHYISTSTFVFVLKNSKSPRFPFSFEFRSQSLLSRHAYMIPGEAEYSCTDYCYKLINGVFFVSLPSSKLIFLTCILLCKGYYTRNYCALFFSIYSSSFFSPSLFFHSGFSLLFFSR